jgi:hypothetical protein
MVMAQTDRDHDVAGAWGHQLTMKLAQPLRTMVTLTIAGTIQTDNENKW